MTTRAAAKAAFSVLDMWQRHLVGPRLLIYHQVGAGHGKEMDVTTSAFRSHLDWLSEHGSVVSLEDAVGALGTPAADSMFVLTFDDGYLDMYENAFPLLNEKQLPFTLYLTTQPIETGTPLATERRSTPLTWDQVEVMFGTGLTTLGAHTHAHTDLRRISAHQIEHELGTCDAILERRLRVVPRHFAYPWGYWSQLADSAVRRRYATATLGGGGANTNETDLFLIHRIPVQLSDGTVFFRHKMRRGQRTEERVRRLLSGYDGP